MYRKAFYPSRLALSIIAIENIAPKCDCFNCQDGFPEMCILHFVEDPFEAHLHDRSYEEWCDALDDRDELGRDESPDSERDSLVGRFGDDDANPSDVWYALGTPNEDEFLDSYPEPGVRASKRIRVDRIPAEVYYGLEKKIIAGKEKRARKSRAFDQKKADRRSGDRKHPRLGMLLSEREEADAELTREWDRRSFAAPISMDCRALAPIEKERLLYRNFPGLSETDARHLATSHSIQSSFVLN